MADTRNGICLVTNYPPGQRRLGGSGWVDRHLLPVLRTLGEVELVCVTGPDSEWSECGVTARAAGGVPLEVRSDRRSLLRIAARMLISSDPYLAAKFTAFPGWPDALALLRTRAAGRHVITSGWPGLVLSQAAQVPVDAHVAHNVESVIAAEHAPAALRLLGERWRLHRREHQLLQAPRQVFALSHRDVVTLNEWGVSARHLPLPLQAGSAVDGHRAVGFIGKASWPPNKRALAELLGPVHEVLTRLDVPVRYVLAGMGTERYTVHPRVARAGPVDDEADFYRQISLMIVPRFGVSTGISVKMLEAAEHGACAVVPSSLAEAVDRSGPWLVADDVTSMAVTIARWWRGVDAPDPHQWLATQHSGRTAAVLAPALLADAPGHPNDGRY